MDPFIAGMLRPEAYDHPVTNLQLLETHISWVILTGTWAYKFKKPVNLGFVDFSTLERRRHFCDEEVRLNQRLAPDLYQGVRPVFGSHLQPSFHGSGEPIEYAVQMQQFDQRQLLPAVLERNEVSGRHIDQLTRDIAEFHQSAAIATQSDEFGTAAKVRAIAINNLQSLQDHGEQSQKLTAIRDWTEAEAVRCEAWFEQRREHGFVRECHGDMHLGNMVLLKDTIRIFDCLEFNPDLRWTDVQAEIAFLVMDLLTRGRRDFALRVLNGWLEQTGDYQGLRGWRWYFVYRAVVRAKVAALRLAQGDVSPSEQVAKQEELEHYLTLAHSITQPPPKTIILMHGLSGSGKSWVSQRICEHFPVIRLRTDVERKRLFGQRRSLAGTRLTGEMYAPASTQHLYQNVLAAVIPTVLQAGFPIIVDAATLQVWQRELMYEVAEREQTRLVVLDVRAPEDVLRARLKERRTDPDEPSDADGAVLTQQLRSYQPLTPVEQQRSLVVDTNSPGWWESLQDQLQTFFS